jgi:hypothetical protein
MSLKPLSLKVPLVLGIEIPCRLERDRTKPNRETQIYAQFLPPRSTMCWPKRFGDIGFSFMDKLLACAGSGACGRNPIHTETH